MLESILGNQTMERVLLTLLIRDDVYARDIAAIFKTSLSSIQNQLIKLEKGGVVVSRLKGRTRLYRFNPRYAFVKELKELLFKALEFVPKNEKEKYYTPRLRPRRFGKPL